MNYRSRYCIRAEQRPMPEILHPEDAIIRVACACICGLDLHLYHGMVPDSDIIYCTVNLILYTSRK
jgi:threonine dehydrogenase-like Zn-dependent dehydrogenase